LGSRLVQITSEGCATWAARGFHHFAPVIGGTRLPSGSHGQEPSRLRTESSAARFPVRKQTVRIRPERMQCLGSPPALAVHQAVDRLDRHAHPRAVVLDVEWSGCLSQRLGRLRRVGDQRPRPACQRSWFPSHSRCWPIWHGSIDSPGSVVGRKSAQTISIGRARIRGKA